MRRRGREAGLLPWFLFLLWANFVTPEWADDYCRTIPGGVFAYVDATWSDYFAWTGRFLVDIATYIAMSTTPIIGPIGFDIINAAFFAGLIYIVSGLIRWAIPTNRPAGFWRDFSDTMAIGLMLFWLPRTIGEVALWKTGAINYLWASVGEFGLLLMMLPNRPAPSWWAVPLAFVSATCLEPLSVMMSALLVAGAIFIHSDREIVKKRWAVAAAHAVGSVLLLAAPGNFVRAAGMPPSPFFTRVAGLIGNLGSLFDLTWLAAGVVTALPFVLAGKGAKWRPGLPFFILALLYMVVLLALPRDSVAARVTFPASVFLICFLGTVWVQRPLGIPGEPGTAVMLSLLMAVHLAVVVPDLLRLLAIHDRWQQIAEAKESDDLVLPLVRIDNRLLIARKYRFFEGFHPDSSYWVNACFARAMGLHSVVAR
jgi:hypothetical protein